MRVERIDTEQISFSQEMLRKATHLFALVIPMGYWLLQLSRIEMLTVMVPITLLIILFDIGRLRQWPLWSRIAAPIFDRMIRSHEQNDFTGATYILLTVCATVAMFPKPIAVAAIAFIVIGDTLAAIVGRRWGKHRLFGEKSFEGSLACLAGLVVVALVSPDLPLAVGLIGAVVATLVEAYPFNIDDNVTVPLLSGSVMLLVWRILT
jgi:dolichol kinase